MELKNHHVIKYGKSKFINRVSKFMNLVRGYLQFVIPLMDVHQAGLSFAGEPLLLSEVLAIHVFQLLRVLSLTLSLSQELPFLGSVASVKDKYKSLIWILFYDANDINDLKVEIWGFNNWFFFIILTNLNFK